MSWPCRLLHPRPSKVEPTLGLGEESAQADHRYPNYHSQAIRPEGLEMAAVGVAVGAVPTKPYQKTITFNCING